MSSLCNEVTLVTVSYNSAEVLPNHIASLRNSTDNKLPRWIIVDNASTDNTDALLADSNDIEQFKCKDNLGFGAACNVGIDASNTPYVLVLNPDTELSYDAIAALLAEMKKTGAAVAGPALEVEEKQITEEVSWIVGAVMLFDKTLMAPIGYFDERFFLYREDVDLCKRVRDAGLKVIHCKGINIPHVGGGSTPRSKKLLKFVNFHKGRSYALFALKHKRGAEVIDLYVKKNRRRMLFACFSFGAARYVRAKAKLDGVASVATNCKS
jgi:N-acetylglucosaminyl-diphospho-decaprenol L-rhamnosyltransferase